MLTSNLMPKSKEKLEPNLNQKTNFLVPEKEKYTCEHCGRVVEGGRYNNHCPHCLWSKHLDEELPGDRASKCRALMEPIGVTQKKGEWRIIHKCTRCYKYTVVDSAPKDDFDLIIQLIKKSLPDDYK